LAVTGGLLAAGLIPRGSPSPARGSPTPSALPTPGAPAPFTTEPRVYFVPLENYHELPPECYEANLIHPLEIILHWDGNDRRDLQLAQVTYQTLKLLKQSSHFAVDETKIWQLLPMYQTVVQESHGAKGYNWEAINIEMAGINFDAQDRRPPESQIRLTLLLVSQLMDFYGLPLAHIVGHFERDERGLKQDPGEKFLAEFRERLQAYRVKLSPLKQMLLNEH